MLRKSEKIEGYDCRGGCEHEIKGDHGQSAEKWRYIVVADDGKSALTLLISSGIYPDEFSTQHNERDSRRIFGESKRFYRSSAFDLSLHVAWRTDLRTVANGTELQVCDLIDRCTGAWTSALQADEFWEKHATGETYEQGESFWKALEDRHDELRAGADPDVDETHQQCAACKGLGVIERKRT